MENYANNEESMLDIPEFVLELGDLIEIISPSNQKFHNQTYYILYIDKQKIDLLNINTYEKERLEINENFEFEDKSIREINLISRSEEKGYAKQNGLLPKTWIDIHFGGEMPMIITGQITNLDGDEIEIMVYPQREIIFIDFHYQGIPENIPIDKIIIRDEPSISKKEEVEIQEEMEKMESDASIHYHENNEYEILIPENYVPEKDARDILHEIYVEANNIFGENLEDVYQMVELEENEKRYNLEVQLNDLTDELLTNIPQIERTYNSLQNIHNLVKRFKELRNQYSLFDKNGNITKQKINVYEMMFGTRYKPLIENILNLDMKIKWIIPVIEQKKKIYDASVINEEKDISIIEMIENIKLESEIHNDYKEKKISFDEFNQRLKLFSVPFEKQDPVSPFIIQQQIHSDMEVFINNYNNFYSSNVFNMTAKNENNDVVNTRYVMQRLNRNDKTNVKSIVCLTKPFIHYSRSQLPGTDILTRTQISHSQIEYFRFLKRKFNMKEKVVKMVEEINKYNSENRQIQIVENEEEETPVLFDDVIHYEIDPSTNINDTYKNFLNSILPDIDYILSNSKDEFKNKMSIVDVIKALEPFMIYSDNITLQQRKEIQSFILKNIKTHENKLSEKRNAFFSLEKYFKSKNRPNEMYKLLQEDIELKDIFIESYGIQNSFFSSEDLKDILTTDNGLLFTNLLSKMLISLITPDKLLDEISIPDVDISSSSSSSSSSPLQSECNKRYLAKKYKNMMELQKDNKKGDIFFDKEYDDTPYEILKKYEKEKKEMSPDKFIRFLMENLIQKHGCPENQAEELANIIVKGKKTVKNGDYAMVVIVTDDKKNTHYYKRQNNEWIREDEFEDMYPVSNSMFCNIENGCYKNETSKTCDTTDEYKKNIKREIHQRLLNEFDKKYNMTVEELHLQLEEKIKKCRTVIKKLRVLQKLNSSKYDYVAQEIGKYANNDTSMISPYAPVYDMIMSQEDFSKKQVDLCQFVNEFCREPMTEEEMKNGNAYWLYCKKTNLKLVPRSLWILANTFLTGGNYEEKQNELCNKIGTLSDDGDSWVDKYCGCILKKIDFVEEQGYDETGFKIITHSVIEKEMNMDELVQIQMEKKQKKVFIDENSDMIYNVCHSLCENMNIPIETVEEFVVRYSTELTHESFFLNEKSYMLKIKNIEKKTGKKQPPYDIYKNQTIILIVSGVLLIALQTAIPSIQVKKTFPGCVLSFRGYPLDGGIEDKSAIRYISCVISKMKSSISPWDSVKKLTVDSLMMRITDVLEKFIVPKNEINELYLKKREYIILNKESENIPAEHSIEKWTHFLPPIVDFSVQDKLQGTTDDFDRETLEMMKKGNRDLHKHIGVYKSKNIQHSYGIIELINKIVKTKGSLLNTSTKIPFLENACCNEKEQSLYPIPYFIQENNLIDVFLKRCEKNRTILNFATEASKPPFIFNNEDTRNKKIENATNHIYEKNIYGAFIHYGNYDVDIPIPQDIEMFYSEKPKKEDGYDIHWSLDEKMDFLKRNGQKYNGNDLQNLMKKINHRSLKEMPVQRSYIPIQIFLDVLNNLENKKSKIIEKNMISLLKNVIQEYQENIDFENKSTPFYKASSKLRIYMSKMISEMNSKILDELFSTNLKKSKKEDIKQYTLNVSNWKKNGMTDMIQFVRNSIVNMSKVYPNIIINKKSLYIKHEHWGFSYTHMKDIEQFVRDFWIPLNKHKKNDDDGTLNYFLKGIVQNLEDIVFFTNHIPFEMFNEKTLTLLLSYCWHSTLYEYLLYTDDENMTALNIKKIKENQHEENKEKNDRHKIDVSTEIIEEIEGMDEIGIFEPDIQELKKNVKHLLIDYIKMEIKSRMIVDKSYDEIVKKVNLTKQQEKKRITDRFGDMTTDERRVENMIKNFHLNEFNVSSNFYLYDKNQYDKGERFTEENEKVAWSVNDLETFDEEENKREEDYETSIQGLSENFMDGEVYAEDFEYVDE